MAATLKSTQRPRSRARRLAILGGPSTRPISGRRWFPLYGLIHHVGRKSGAKYSTPVVVRSSQDGVYVPLPFGDQTDWYRNALAAGSVEVKWRGRHHRLTGATVVGREIAGSAFNPIMSALMKAAGISHVVRFDPIESGANI